MALHASYALEAFRFMVSFATSLAMVENKIFIGLWLMIVGLQVVITQKGNLVFQCCPDGIDGP